MTVKQILRTCSRLTLAFYTVLVIPLAARAAIVTFDLKDATRDTGWSIQYDDSQVTVLLFTGLNDPDNRRLQGTLEIDKVFNDLKPIEIKFVESAAEIAKADNFGLRINLFENITNQTGG